MSNNKTKIPRDLSEGEDDSDYGYSSLDDLSDKENVPPILCKKNNTSTINKSNLIIKEGSDIVALNENNNEETTTWISLERLRVPVSQGGAALSANDINRLIEAGFATVESIAFTPLKKIIDSVSGIGEQKARAMKSASMKLIPSGFSSASNFHVLRKNLLRLTTGSLSVDSILKGGIETGSITEFFGEFRTGKSQFCMTLCVTCQLPISMGGLASRALYIDTEGTFRTERLEEICQRYNMNPDQVVKNVEYARAYTSEHQQELLKNAAGILASEKNRFGLIVVDSITSLFRTDFQGRGELAERQQMIGKFMRSIQRLADEFGVAVVITNQVMASVDGSTPAYCNPSALVKPVGGHVLAHASQTRLMLKKSSGDKRILKIFDSPLLPETEAPYCITMGGISDLPENNDNYNNQKRRKTV